MKTRFLLALLLALLVITTTGCSNFRSSRRLDVAPFAENTINMVAEISYGLDTNHAVYLRRYRGDEGGKAYRAHWEYFRPVLRGIGIYSLGLVTISRSNITEKEKAEQLADFMDRLFAQRLATQESRLNLTPARIDEIITNVREQGSFLEALGAAQPVIDEVARFSGEYLDVILNSQDEVQRWLAQTIDQDFATVLEFEQEAKEAQLRNLKKLAHLANYSQGRDQDALDKAVENDLELRDLLPADGSAPDRDTLQAMEDRLMVRLTHIQKLDDMIATDLETYRNMTMELDELVLGANQNLKRTRLTIIVWAAAHRRLAAGITDPAKIDMMSIAKNALAAAMPF